MMLNILSGIAFLGGMGLLAWQYGASFKNDNKPKITRNDLKNFCILIPARDESLVIEDLLISIKRQSIVVNMNDVYVIVEDSHDKTISIALKYGVSYFVRKQLDLKSKGYALDEMIKDLERRKKYYDAYFIIDADNVLDKDFIKNMGESYKQGYDIATSYRNMKNGNDSVIAACSGITFAFLNTNGNKYKSRRSLNVTLSGTGLFIAGDLIRKWQSFPFHSLTEDYELTLYSIENSLTSVYNDRAIFYDEQPIKYKNTINQRMRWIRGYFDNRKTYIPRFRKILKNNPNRGSVIYEIVGMWPYILMVISVLLFVLGQILEKFNYQMIICVLVLIYLILAFLTFIVILKDKRLDLDLRMKIKTILVTPLFFFTYIPCALRAILKKNVSWIKVEHTRRWKDN